MKSKNKIVIVIVASVVVIVISSFLFFKSKNERMASENIPQPNLAKSELKDLPVAPENKRVDIKKPVFSNPTNITNPLFPVNDLKQAILLGNDDGKPLQVNYTLLPENKNKIISWDGKKIETRTIQYSAYLDRRLIEYAYDWYAQADDGSVWYFGEDVFNLADGVITDTHGTWLGGKDGPIAMIMPANPKAGDVYRVENIPGVAFEEVEVKSINTTVDGPLGKVSGCMIGTQLHDNGSYSDKTFCPGYGEFFTEKDLDLEAVAHATPTNVLSKPIPAELSSITLGALRIYDALQSDNWETAEKEFKLIKFAWNKFIYNPDKVSSRFAAQMDRAIRGLEGDIMEPAILARHKIGTQNGALDVAFAGLDLEMRYRPFIEIDMNLATIWARKTLIDARALESGFVLSDAKALDLIFERIMHVLPRDKAETIKTLIDNLKNTAEAEEFEKTSDTAEQLLDIFSEPFINQNPLAEDYNPSINPKDFSTNITNKYFALPIGKKLIFEADTEDGPEKIVIEITGETKVIEGVTTLVYLDTVYKNGQIYEITKDYLAQHKNGDVWYFGENVDNYENGKLKDHAGTFIHGEDGAKAGIWMKAIQKVGDSYRQEYYKGEAEDVRDTVATGITVTTKLGTFTDCVKVYDWTPLDNKSREHKTYCPKVGALVLVEHLETGKRSELIETSNP